MNRLTLLCLIVLLAVLTMLIAKPRRSAEAPPAPVRAEQPGLQPKPIHAMRARELSGADEYLVRNLLPGPIEVRCVLESGDNILSDPPLPRRLVLPAQVERVLAELRLADPSRPGRSMVSCESMVGDPNAHPAHGHRYVLPFPGGTRFTLDQGFGGRASHDNDENRYALDLAVPEGTAVLAARAGVVVQVEDDFRATGTDARFADRANYVRILHDDGSMALYAHLAPGSMLRRPGDQVRLGQLVGKSGNTGFSTGPHLHFVVQRNAGMALVAIPIEVEGVDPRNPRN